MRLSKLTLFFGLWVILSASFMRQALEFFWSVTGDVYAALYTNILFLALGIAVVYLLIVKNEISALRLLAISILLVAAYAYIKELKYLAEKIHIIEYGVFGWLACRDLAGGKEAVKGVFLALLVCFLVGSLDEGFQAILPYRVFDLRDIRMNFFGGIEGVAIYLLSRK